MKGVAELQNERALVMSEAEELLEAAEENERMLSEDEDTRFKGCMDRVKMLDTEIDRRKQIEAVQIKSIEAKSTPRPVAEDKPQPKIEIPRSYGKLTAFPKTKEGEMNAFRSGQFIRAAIYGDTKAADWCRQHGVGIRSALAGGINSAGGVLVPEELERAIIDLREEYGLFRRLVRVRPMSSDTMIIPRRTGGVTAYYVGENEAGTESDPSWDNVQLVAKKLMVLTRMSTEISDDAIIDMADTLASEIAYAFALKEDQVGFIGDGTSTYGGIRGVNVVAIDGSHGKAKVTATGGDQFAELTADDLLSLMSAIPMYAKRGAVWVCSPTALELTFNALKIAGGGNTRDMLSAPDQPRFLGYPIMVTDIYPDVTTALSGSVMIGFGNLAQAVSLGDRRGIRVGLSNERYWENDQIGVKGTMRHDINVHDMGSDTVKSPFAVLVGA